MTGQRPKRAVVTYIVSQMGEDREQKRDHGDHGMLAIEAQGFANLDDPVTKRQAPWQRSRPRYAENEQRTKRRAAKDGEREIGDMRCPRSVVQPAKTDQSYHRREHNKGRQSQKPIHRHGERSSQFLARHLLTEQVETNGIAAYQPGQ